MSLCREIDQRPSTHTCCPGRLGSVLDLALGLTERLVERNGGEKRVAVRQALEHPHHDRFAAPGLFSRRLADLLVLLPVRYLTGLRAVIGTTAALAAESAFASSADAELDGSGQAGLQRREEGEAEGGREAGGVVLLEGCREQAGERR